VVSVPLRCGPQAPTPFCSDSLVSVHAHRAKSKPSHQRLWCHFGTFVGIDLETENYVFGVRIQAEESSDSRVKLYGKFASW
jgi:hypothetical protein